MEYQTVCPFGCFVVNQEDSSFSETFGRLWLCLAAMCSSDLKRKACRYLLFIRVNAWELSLPAQKIERKKKDFAMVFGLVLCKQSQCHFLVVVIVVVHVSYYITVYLMMSSLVYGLDMCVQGGDVRWTSQYRKMLYFCYEIYYAYLYPSRNYVYFFCCGWMPVFNPWKKL